MSDMKEVLDRVHAPGAFRHWRMSEETPLQETQVYPVMQRNAQGLESYAQMLRRHLTDGNEDGVRRAMEGLLQHAQTLADVFAPEAAEYIQMAARRCGTK